MTIFSGATASQWTHSCRPDRHGSSPATGALWRPGEPGLDHMARQGRSRRVSRGVRGCPAERILRFPASEGASPMALPSRDVKFMCPLGGRHESGVEQERRTVADGASRCRRVQCGSYGARPYRTCATHQEGSCFIGRSRYSCPHRGPPSPDRRHRGPAQRPCRSSEGQSVRMREVDADHLVDEERG